MFFIKKYLKPEILLIHIFLITFIIYFSTMLPGVGFWDTGEFQTIVYTFDVAHPTGYPTYLILGKIFTLLFPFGSIAWRVNLLSVLFSSLGIYLLALSIHNLTKNYLLSFAAGFFMLTNPYLWSVSTSADPHSLHFLFFSIIFYLTILTFNHKGIKYFPVLTLVVGLALGNHFLSLFFIPPIVVLFLVKRRMFSSELLQKSLLFFLVGISVYLIIFLLGKIKPPLTTSYDTGSLTGLIRHVAGGDFRPFMLGWTKGNLKETLLYFYSISQNFFGLPLLVISLLGIFLIFSLSLHLGLFLLLLLLGILLFSLRYQNAFLERYFIVPYSILTAATVLTPAGVKKLSENIKPKNQKLYFSFISIFMATILLLQGAVNFIQFYRQKNQSKNFSAQEYVNTTFNSLAPNGVILSWWSYSTPLWYEQKVEGKRSDITIINADQNQWENEAAKYVQTKPVYFLEKIPLLNSNYRLVPEGNLFRYLKIN